MAKRGQCQVCHHSEVLEIDRLLLSGEAGTRTIAKKFGVSRDSVNRHKAGHLAKDVAAATGAVVTRVDPNPSGLLQTLAEADRHVTATLEKAGRDGDGDLVLKAAAERRRQVEFYAKLMGELPTTGYSRADVWQLTLKMAAVVEAVVRDPEQRERIEDDWKRIRLP